MKNQHEITDNLDFYQFEVRLTCLLQWKWGIWSIEHRMRYMNFPFIHFLLEFSMNFIILFFEKRNREQILWIISPVDCCIFRNHWYKIIIGIVVWNVDDETMKLPIPFSLSNWIDWKSWKRRRFFPTQNTEMFRCVKCEWLWLTWVTKFDWIDFKSENFPWHEPWADLTHNYLWNGVSVEFFKWNLVIDIDIIYNSNL